MPWYRSLPAIVKTIWPTLHRQQTATLALLVELILRQRSLCLADLARGSFADRDFTTRYQQLWRWTQNERIQSRTLRRALAHTALAWRAGHGQYVPIIVDTTACRQFRIGHPQGGYRWRTRSRGDSWNLNCFQPSAAVYDGPVVGAGAWLLPHSGGF